MREGRRTESPCAPASAAVWPWDTLVARSWNEVYTKPRYGLFSVLGAMPLPMRFWMVTSIARMSTRPQRYRYLFSRSPAARCQACGETWSLISSQSRIPGCSAAG